MASTDPAEVRERIAHFVGAPHARGLVAAYFKPSSGFAGALFDGLERGGLLTSNPPGRFTTDDISAASLLDVRFGPIPVRALLGSPEITRALKAVPDNIPLWKMDDGVFRRANHLWNLVGGIVGVGPTRTSKLLARKRPALVPIEDSVIRDALLLHDETWRPLAEALQDTRLRRQIVQLRPRNVSKAISTLRLLDVAVWMSCSRSSAAVKVQLAEGAPPARDLP
ncbi:DUF6308 family protein [Nocardioides pelophilus]|uniref:DUF6308 family protein n=1 Tax=Nocardioides pelophilus TaxID=2172019 RepID=UPI001C807A63